jgi:hypothetical protein
MSGYLEAYGAGDEKRAKLIRRVVLAVVLVLVAGTTFYFLFRNYRETQQAKLFLRLLSSRDYPAAYALWGCTEASPCRDYTLKMFLEDWGPQSPHNDTAALKISNTWGCSDGVIIELQSGTPEPDYLWVDRSSRNVGYAPQYVSGMRPVCNPRMPVP